MWGLSTGANYDFCAVNGVDINPEPAAVKSTSLFSTDPLKSICNMHRYSVQTVEWDGEINSRQHFQWLLSTLASESDGEVRSEWSCCVSVSAAGEMFFLLCVFCSKWGWGELSKCGLNLSATKASAGSLHGYFRKHYRPQCCCFFNFSINWIRFYFFSLVGPVQFLCVHVR